MRNIGLLEPIVRKKWLAVVADCEKAGIDVMVIETLRTPEVQEAYYAQGREPLKKVNALRHIAGLWLIDEEQNRIITKTMQSIHFYGCAIDFALVIDGKPSWNTKADINGDDIFDYKNVGIIGEKHGFRWGGRFSFKDYAHLEYTGGLTLEQLKQGQRPT